LFGVEQREQVLEEEFLFGFSSTIEIVLASFGNQIV
jgi:hypothetical protein